MWVLYSKFDNSITEVSPTRNVMADLATQYEIEVSDEQCAQIIDTPLGHMTYGQAMLVLTSAFSVDEGQVTI